MAYKIRVVTSKQDLKKPDEFLSLMDRLGHFLQDNAGALWTAAGVAALIGLAAGGIWYYQERREEAARSIEYQAARYYHQDPPAAEKEKTPPPNREENIKKALEIYQQLVKEYPRTRTARLAQYYIGNAYMDLKDYDNAIAAYRSFLDSKSEHDVVRGAANLRLGYAHLSRSHSEEALQAFEAIPSIGGALNKDLAYYEIGLLNESLGRKEKAVESYQEIVKKFPDSLYLAQTQSRLNAMGITEVKPDQPQTRPAGDSAVTSGTVQIGPAKEGSEKK